jgi:two-component system sensor histidine kinase PilS (NtrC family)
MESTTDLRSWLLWVIKIRFVIITLVFAIDYAIRQLVPSPGDVVTIRHLGIAIILWYILGLFYLIYYQLGRDYLLQAHLQIYVDIVMVTAIVHVTGDLESNYLSLYLISIIVASILLPRPRAYLVAAVSFVFLGSLLELAYLPSLYPSWVERHPALGFLATSSATLPDMGTLEVKIFASLFGFFAVAYLAGYLAENLRRTGAELRHKTGQVASLHAINENIIQSMRGGLIRTDLDGNIHELNPAGAAILGRSPAELKGQSIFSVLSDLKGSPPAGGEDAPEPASPAPPLPPVRREINYWHPRGEQRVLGISASPLTLPEAGVVGTIYTFQDLTDEKRREAQYRAKDRMAALGRMAAAIAHEIRNPLASIAGSVKLLQSLSDLQGDQAQLIDIVRRESGRLEKLVSDFLAYSREQKFEFRPADIVNLVEETLLLAQQHPLFTARCRLERRFPGHPVILTVDPDKLRQVFWNICDNALKAMPEGGTLTAEIHERRDGGVEVTFSDTGVGLAPAQAERMFEPFHSQFSNGTGLGMAISQQIVEGHRGRIRVQSRPGEGTRFMVELPAAANSMARSILSPAGRR